MNQINWKVSKCVPTLKCVFGLFVLLFCYLFCFVLFVCCCFFVCLFFFWGGGGGGGEVVCLVLNTASKMANNPLHYATLNQDLHDDVQLELLQDHVKFEPDQLTNVIENEANMVCILVSLWPETRLKTLRLLYLWPETRLKTLRLLYKWYRPVMFISMVDMKAIS